MIDSYLTLAKPATARVNRKKSRFLGFVFPIDSAERIEEKRAELRRTYRDATHHCWASRLLCDELVIESADDDGEPAGSSGPPILHHLSGADVVNVLAVVVRYYGGTKLGVGGLIRAYGDTAHEALAKAPVVRKRVTVHLQVSYPPEVTSGVMATLHRFDAQIERIEYDALATAVVGLPPSQVNRFRDAIREATGAQATMEVLA